MIDHGELFFFVLAISPPGVVRGVLELLFSSGELRCLSFKLLLSPLARDTFLTGVDGIPAKAKIIGEWES